ncbi:MAG: Crp/Fnr family transcriptional regulator [Gammaproteobacteria bacterium]|nr:Crp/Fnr family transcriptional regulator [Gammaproteobacteria bacterium]MBU1645024.1 Crp/Fnr family transcriptional regulator [Gammaproteobacteria bacterium]MBU1971201.1 Crp/Fnr family transcriptional regulator [Gammaproteobacteria bacterium]
MPDNLAKKPPSLAEVLRDSRWTCDLSDAELARVEAGIFERTIAAGHFACRKGEPVEHWLGVIDGLVKVSSDLDSGKTATLTGVPPGGWFGEGSMLKTDPRKYDAVALRESRIAYMRRETFQWLIDHSIGFNRFLLLQLNERLGQFIGLLESERLLDIDTRVARCLASLFNPVLYPGLGRRLAISQAELGYLAGVSRQRINRALKVLAEAGCLSVEYGGISIHDLDRLRRFGG